MSKVTIARVCGLCTILLGSILVIPPALSLAGDENGSKPADTGGGQGGAGKDGGAISSHGTQSPSAVCTTKQTTTESDSNCAGTSLRYYEICIGTQVKQVGGRKRGECVG